MYRIGEWILPETIQVTVSGANKIIRNWTYEPVGGFFRITDEPGLDLSSGDTLVISYRAYPLALRRLYERKELAAFDSSLIETDSDSLSALIFESQRGSLNYTRLDQSGSLSRGIIVGTNQDFALESGLNFELSGQLTDDINIEAALTDRSIPIQPDGSTQNLREFDRVFIQMRSPTTRLQMGDVDVSFENSTFARLNRRLQGAAAYNRSRAGKYSGAASVVRGRYRNMTFEGRDGVQGPYRLTGDQNEEFVIVLAGTERVYINGQQVQRGEENEYIIDYGLGEVWFTNNLLVKDETRIFIEYEYIDQNFNRTLIAGEGGAELLDGRLKVGVSVIREADGDQLLSQRSLTESEIELLKQAGDDPDAAIVSGAERYDPETDTEVNVLYALTDTTLNGQSYTVYVNKPGSPESVYRVRFSNVGEGNGSYKRVGASVNGIVYEWAGPGGGAYEPFRRLPSPEKQQMAALQSSFALSKHLNIRGEWAVSDFDQNRFSSLDDNDNVDFSYLGGIGLNAVETGIGTLSAGLNRRFTGKDFRFFERIREVEFDRKWNLPESNSGQEVLNEAKLNLDFSEKSFANAEYGYIEREGFAGYRQAAQVSVNETDMFGIDYSQDWIRSSNDIIRSRGNWFRQRGVVNRRIDTEGTSLTPYLVFEQERRSQTSATSDSLSPESFSFFDIAPGMEFRVGAAELDYSIALRRQQGVLDNELQQESEAVEHRLRLSLETGDHFASRNELRFRSREFTDQFAARGAANRNGILIRSNTSYGISRPEWEGEWLYEVNTQRQALLQETYIKVGPELGQFTWNDLNGDGVEQIDEFFPELSPNEGTYLRQLLPSDELFPSVNLKARWINDLHPLGFLKERGSGWSGFLSRISLRSRIDISENSTTTNLQDIYLMRLKSFRNDSTTIQGRLSWEKELSLMPGYERADLDIRYNQIRSLNQRSTEQVSVYQDAWAADTRIDISGRTQGFMTLSTATDRTLSNTLVSRNFDIRSKGIETGVHTTVNRSLRSGLIVSYMFRKDENPAVPTTAKTFKIRGTTRAFLFRRMQTNAFMEIRNTRVDGTTSRYGFFELTEGLGEGVNYVWNLNGSYRMNDLLRISFNYDGRTVRDRPDIHSFKVVVNALF